MTPTPRLSFRHAPLSSTRAAITDTRAAARARVAFSTGGDDAALPCGRARATARQIRYASCFHNAVAFRRSGHLVRRDRETRMHASIKRPVPGVRALGAPHASAEHLATIAGRRVTAREHGERLADRSLSSSRRSVGCRAALDATFGASGRAAAAAARARAASARDACARGGAMHDDAKKRVDMLKLCTLQA